MKKQITNYFLLALLVSFSVHARTKKVADEKSLLWGDLNYFLKTSQHMVSFDVNNKIHKETADGSDTLQTRGYINQLQYAFGIWDHLNVDLAIDYAFRNEVENKSTSAKTYERSGFSNPSLSAQYRLFNQNNFLVNWDLGLSTKINLEESSLGRPGRDGNFANGRSSVEFNTSVGKKWNIANEWRMTVGAVYFNDGEEKSTSSIDVDSSLDLFLRGSYQYRPVHEFMMELNLDVRQVGEVTRSQNVVDESHLDLDFLFNAKYLVTHRLIAHFRYGISHNANFDRTVNNVATEIKKRREGFYGIGVDFLF